MGRTLFDMDEDIRTFIENLYVTLGDEDGVVSDLAFDELEHLKAERDTKLENVCMYYKECVIQEKALKEEAAKLLLRAKHLAKEAEFFKNYMATSMIKNGEPEFRSARCVMTFRSSDTLEIDDIDRIPEQYLRKNIDISADKDALKKAIKAGEKIDGCHLETHKNIQIK